MVEKKTAKTSVFETLYAVDVSKKIEQKEANKGQTLSYLSWVWAWAETQKIYPEATYEIKKFPAPDGTLRPYMVDEMTGYMVFTEVTIEGITREMWMSVMNSNNKAMKPQPYNYSTKWGNKKVEAATMFEVNKAIMRCLVKNLGMFGLGLTIYAGEDLPDLTDAQIEAQYKAEEAAYNEKLAKAQEQYQRGRAAAEGMGATFQDLQYWDSLQPDVAARDIAKWIKSQPLKPSQPPEQPEQPTQPAADTAQPEQGALNDNQ